VQLGAAFVAEVFGSNAGHVMLLVFVFFGIGGW